MRGAHLFSDFHIHSYQGRYFCHISGLSPFDVLFPSFSLILLCNTFNNQEMSAKKVCYAISCSHCLSKSKGTKTRVHMVKQLPCKHRDMRYISKAYVK